jgi:cytochrome P450
MEAQAVLRQLVTRVQQIIPEGPTRWSSHSSLRGPTHLPIRLTAA